MDGREVTCLSSENLARERDAARADGISKQYSVLITSISKYSVVLAAYIYTQLE